MDSPADQERHSGARVIGSSVWSRTRRRSGTGGDGPDARTRILDAAEELFAVAGYEATATAQIAKKAGVPKGLVFHYFPRKMDVLVTLVQERTDVEVLRDDQVGTQVGTQQGDPASMLALLARRVPLRASPAMRRILFREADTHGTVRERLRHLNSEIVRRARFALELALPGSRGDAARLEAAAATFAVVLLYQENLSHLTGERIDPDVLADLIARALG
ncbi:helix-turn-helix domain-containing protein [Thermopolyspora sp. NPDC052614]|uniref:TetR/AcrR family transcriptional regulator n=1 Tax=Thermopolyspora sp. NPDC052614 TaxID=3155682 RepID=UPI003441CF6D